MNTQHKEFSLPTLIMLIILPILLICKIGTFLCQIYGLVIGSSIVWSCIASAFRCQFIYIIGFSNPLPLFQFNPGLGNFCLGWGILYSVIIAWRKEPRSKIYFFDAAIFAIANLIVGLINLFIIQSDFAISIRGVLSSILSFFMGLSIVITILQSWKSKS